LQTYVSRRQSTLGLGLETGRLRTLVTHVGVFTTSVLAASAHLSASRNSAHRGGLLRSWAVNMVVLALVGCLWIEIEVPVATCTQVKYILPVICGDTMAVTSRKSCPTKVAMVHTWEQNKYCTWWTINKRRVSRPAVPAAAKEVPNLGQCWGPFGVLDCAALRAVTLLDASL
jgi:hypothetical protein